MADALVYSGFEIGIALPYPGGQHRARLWLRASSPFGRSLHPLHPAAAQPADLGFDQRAYAVLGDRGYFDSRRRARSPSSLMDSHGSPKHPTAATATWCCEPDQKPRVLEALVQLSSQPPQCDRGQRAMTGYLFNRVRALAPRGSSARLIGSGGQLFALAGCRSTSSAARRQAAGSRWS